MLHHANTSRLREAEANLIDSAIVHGQYRYPQGSIGTGAHVGRGRLLAERAIRLHPVHELAVRQRAPVAGGRVREGRSA
jgi:hypothetical protein